MQNYKDINNKVHVLEHVKYSNLLPSGCVPITQAEADILNAPTPEQIAQEAKRLEEKQQADNAKTDAVIQYLITHTPAECSAYVAANVTNLATAVNMLQKFAIALCVLSKDKFR